MVRKQEKLKNHPNVLAGETANHVGDAKRYKRVGGFKGFSRLNKSTTWTSNRMVNTGGDGKKFENDKIAIRWYPSTSLLTIKRADSNNLQGNLALIAKEEPEMTGSNSENETSNGEKSNMATTKALKQQCY